MWQHAQLTRLLLQVPSPPVHNCCHPFKLFLLLVFLPGPFLGAIAATPSHYFYNSSWDTKRGDPTSDPLALSKGRGKVGTGHGVRKGGSEVGEGVVLWEWAILLGGRGSTVV